MAKFHHTPHGYRNNYVDSVVRSLRDVVRWQWNRLRHHLPHDPKHPTPRVVPDLDFIRDNAGTAMVPAVTWIGHATSLVQAGGLNVLTDPIFSQRASPFSFMGPRRAQLPGIALDALPHIDVVVVSHNHYDHLDRESIRWLARQPGGPPLYLVPLGLKTWLARLDITNAVELDWWDIHTHAGVEFHFTPAQHWSGRGLSDRNKTLWGAWAVLGADCHWYFSGDTGYSPDFADTRRHFAARQTAERGGGFDVALIAVGACEPRWFMQPQHVDPAEAVQIHLDLAAKRSVGIHWGTFALADEPLDHAVDALAAARVRRDVPEEAFFLIAVGETHRLPVR
jgi:N-acyl-phosphatidylethanolamine-hydrolysing phospholipase D